MNREAVILDILASACDDPRVLSQPDLDLLGEDLLDSLGMLQLLDGVEEALGLAVFPTQVSREALATPNKVVETVLSLLAERGEPGG